MRRLLSVLTLALVASPSVAQQVCMSENTSIAFTSSLALLQNVWGMSKYTAPQTLTNITGMDVMLGSSADGHQTDVGIWSVDPVSGEPLALLTSGLANVNRTPLLCSATLSPPVSILQGTDFYVGALLGPSNGISTRIYNSTSVGTLGAFYAGGVGNWTAVGNRAIAFDIYCGTHSGSSTHWGTGKVGHNSLTPALYLQGFPNLTNTVTIQMADAAPGVLGGFAIGGPVPVPGISYPGFGTLYVTPILANFAGITVGTSPATLTVGLSIPADVSYVGVTLAFQGWVLDPAAVNSLSHSDAFSITIGN